MFTTDNDKRFMNPHPSTDGHARRRGFLGRSISAPLLALTLAVGTPALIGCSSDGPAEEAGEEIDDVLDGQDTPAENAAESLEDAADDVAEATDEAAEAAENTAEDVAEAAEETAEDVTE